MLLTLLLWTLVLSHGKVMPYPQMVSYSPRIAVADSVFTAMQCAELCSLAGPSLIDSSDPTVTMLTEQKDTLLSYLKQRVADIAMMPLRNLDTIELREYSTSQSSPLGFHSGLSIARYATVWVFLSDVPSGGALVFPNAKPHPGVDVEGVFKLGSSDLNDNSDMEFVCEPENGAFTIMPQLGRVVVFFSHLPDLKSDSVAAIFGACRPHDKSMFVAQVTFTWVDPGHSNNIHTILSSVGLDAW